MKTKGILIMALGHPNYGRMALQLAVSLKNVSPDIDITLAYTHSAIGHIEMKFDLDRWFHKLLPVPKDMFTRNGQTEYIKAKTHMYDLSPYDTTILLDADIIMFPRHGIEGLFNDLSKKSFTIQNRGFTDLSKKSFTENEQSYWVDMHDLKASYGFKTGKYWHVHSEMVYFKKNQKNLKLFMDVVDNYNDLKCDVKTVFAGAIPDELPLSIALRQNNIDPHQEKYTPIYWPVLDKTNLGPLENYYDHYLGYSTGGSFHNQQMKKNYNRLAKVHSRKAGVSQVYHLQDKRRYMPERTNI